MFSGYKFYLFKLKEKKNSNQDKIIILPFQKPNKHDIKLLFCLPTYHVWIGKNVRVNLFPFNI